MRSAGARTVQRHDVQVAEMNQHQQKPQEKSHIPQAGHDERLLAGFAGAELFIPESDQKIGGQAHQLPVDVKLNEGQGNGEGGHGPGKQRHERIIARKARVSGHVAEGINLHETTDDGHNDQHEQADRVDQESEGNREVPGGHPPHPVAYRCLGLPEPGQQPNGAHQRHRYGRHRYGGGAARVRPQKNDDHREGGRRRPGGQYRQCQGGNQRSGFDHANIISAG